MIRIVILAGWGDNDNCRPDFNYPGGLERLSGVGLVYGGEKVVSSGRLNA